MKKGRETPGGLCSTAAGFYLAAKGVCDDKGVPETHCLLVYYFLTAHSVELSCKAVLLQDGIKIDSLRRKEFGHNLVALVNEMDRRSLLKDIPLVHIVNAKSMSDDYSRRLYNYPMELRRYSLPLPPQPLDAARTFLKLASDFCGYELDVLAP